MIKKKKMDVLLFDLDGTLVDSAQDIVEAVQHTARHFRVPVPGAAAIISYVGKGARRLIADALGSEDEALVTAALNFFEHYYVEHIVDHARLYDGVRSTLDMFGGKKKMIVTNRNRVSAERILSALDIRHYFITVVAGNDAPDCVKPSACPVHQALRDVIYQPERAVMIGDMDVDIAAGKAAGIATCAVTYGIGTRESLIAASPDMTIHQLTDLQQVIE